MDSPILTGAVIELPDNTYVSRLILPNRTQCSPRSFCRLPGYYTNSGKKHYPLYEDRYRGFMESGVIRIWTTCFQSDGGM